MNMSLIKAKFIVIQYLTNYYTCKASWFPQSIVIFFHLRQESNCSCWLKSESIYLWELTHKLFLHNRVDSLNCDRCRTVLSFINVLGINAPFYNLLTAKNAQPFMPNLSAVKLAKRGSRISKALFRFAFTLSTRAMLLSRSETYNYTKSEDVTI